MAGKNGTPVLSPHWWWSSNSCPEVWVVLRQTEALSLHVACIRRPPANDLDFRGTDRFILVAKSFFLLDMLNADCKMELLVCSVPQ